jgi:uncharacterized membrane protein YagU involved in acid resistance
MNWGSWLLSGFAATLVLSALLALSQGLGLTRMNVPYLLGTVVTHDRDKARLYGFFVHMLNGMAFSIIYVLIFETTRNTSWWLGMTIGLVQALFVLTIVTMLLPTLHPRMANERQGPTARRQLEPPGFMALNYGYQTPVSVFLSHGAFGIIIAALYRLH